MTLVQNSSHLTTNLQNASIADVLPDESVIFGDSEPMASLRAKLKVIANSNLPVLIEGESGTGKVVIARLLHRWSPVAAGLFVQVSCPAIPGTPLERELFGYEKSSNGQNGHRQGGLFFPIGGTICLDEIGELDVALQAKLLQLLQNGKFRPIGCDSDSGAEIRLVCATSRDLERDVAANNFRRDLFYRINVVKVQLPPLRERAIDLPALCSYFLALYNREFNCNAKPLSPTLLHQLQRYHWPGNIRQLENLMKRYIVLGAEDVFRNELTAKMHPSYTFPEMHGEAPVSLPDASREVRRAFEREQILKALEANQWNRRRAALALNISYRALLYKLKESQCEIPAED
jgi:two-component system response regulator AtoC